MFRALCLCVALVMCDGFTFTPSGENLSAEEIAVLVAGFNAKRRLHNACPLVYDEAISDEIRPDSTITVGGEVLCAAITASPGISYFRQYNSFSAVDAIAQTQPVMVTENIIKDWYGTHFDSSQVFKNMMWKGTASFGCAVCRTGEGFVSFGLVGSNVICKFKAHEGTEADNVDLDPVPFTAQCGPTMGDEACDLPPMVKVGGVAQTGEAVDNRDAIGHYTDIPSQFGSTHMWAFEDVSPSDSIEIFCQDCACDVVINILHCPPCTLMHDGGYPMILPNEGYSSGSCAAKHEDEPKFTGYHTTADAGVFKALPERTNTLKYLVIFARQGPIDGEGWCPAVSAASFIGPQQGRCYGYCRK